MFWVLFATSNKSDGFTTAIYKFPHQLRNLEILGNARKVQSNFLKNLFGHTKNKRNMYKIRSTLIMGTRTTYLFPEPV